MVTVTKKITVVCLDCQRLFELMHSPVRDVIITCPHCGIDLEVIGVDPLELDFYYEEDWDDDENGDDDGDWDEDEDWDEDWE